MTSADFIDVTVPAKPKPQKRKPNGSNKEGMLAGPILPITDDDRFYLRRLVKKRAATPEEETLFLEMMLDEPSAEPA